MTEKSQEKTEITDRKLEKLIEPEGFYIISDNRNFVLDSKEDVEVLLKSMNNVKYNEKLAKEISSLNHKIKDLTKDSL